jgi:hypothetical protein
MLSIVLSALAGVALLAAGWFASAWHHGRKLQALNQHLKSVKAAHAEVSAQMRRQIGQLQADLEAHKAAVPPARRTPEPPPARPVPVSTREERAAAVEAMLGTGGGFAPTMVVAGSGFAATEVMQ